MHCLLLITKKDKKRSSVGIWVHMKQTGEMFSSVQTGKKNQPQHERQEGGQDKYIGFDGLTAVTVKSIIY